MRHKNISWWRKWDWGERETWLTWGWNTRRMRIEVKLQWDLGYGGRIEMGFLGAWFNLTYFTRDLDLQRQFLRDFAPSRLVATSVENG